MFAKMLMPHKRRHCFMGFRRHGHDHMNMMSMIKVVAVGLLAYQAAKFMFERWDD